MRQQPKSNWPQRCRAGVAARRKDGREEHEPRASCFCAAHLHDVMRRCRQRAATPPVRAIGLPGARLFRRACQNEHQPAPPRNRPHRLKQSPPLNGRCRIMPEDDARATRQGAHRLQQGIAQPFIGHQPQPGQEVVALRHCRPYSARMTNDAKTRLAEVRDAMARVCKTAGRAPGDVALIAISKTHDADAIRPLIAAGQRAFGENRVQEAEGKWPALLSETPGIELHLVGQLQSNKAEEAIGLFDVIHSVDRSSLIAALGKAQAKTGRHPRCFLQVNIGEEEQKGGCGATDVPALLAEARAAGLDIVGLMAVPPAETEAAPYFALLAKIARDNGLTQLSMGMSGDYEAAIMLGATQVRIGTALFGSRG